MSGAIGPILRDTRLKRGIELDDVERATKIRARYIEAIENESWAVLPGRAYARGFLRTYAELLDLDPEPLLAELDQDLATADADEERPPEPVVQPGTLPRGPGGRFRRRLVAIALVAIAAIAIAAVALTVTDGEGNDDPEPVPEEEEEPTASEEPELETETPVEPPVSEPERVTVTLAATGEVWICMVDGSGEALVDSEVLQQGEERGPFEARRVLMNLGNGQVEVTADDEEVEVTDAGEPIGFEVSTDGVSELPPGDRPTCA